MATNPLSPQLSGAFLESEFVSSETIADRIEKPGRIISQLRQQIRQTPGDIERRTSEIASKTGDRSYFISHSQLHKVEEENSVFGVFKLCSLAVTLGISVEELLGIYGINVEMLRQEFGLRLSTSRTALPRIPEKTPPLREIATAALKTNLIDRDVQERLLLPFLSHDLSNQHRYTFGVIGKQDGCESDLIPPGTIVQIDRKFNTTERNAQPRGRRPIYFTWYDAGYICSWCELEGRDLTIIPFSSDRKFLHFKVPRDAEIIGRVVGVIRFLDPV